jgi:hypothetical protein
LAKLGSSLLVVMDDMIRQTIVVTLDFGARGIVEMTIMLKM